MTGKISAFYGAPAKQDNGQPAGEFPNKTEVTILVPFGQVAWHLGEWVKVQSATLTGWVKAEQVHCDYN